MNFLEVVTRIETESPNLVWWSKTQLERGENLENNPTKGERPWSIPRPTGEFLRTFILEHAPKIILELGTSVGYSTVWMASAAAEIGGHIHTIEMQPHKCDIAKRNIADAELADFVTFHQGRILETIPNLPNDLMGQKIDLVFMDADRGHYHEYFKILEPMIAANATIIADNAINMQTRMSPFLELLKEYGWDYNILNFDNGILIASKKHETS